MARGYFGGLRGQAAILHDTGQRRGNILWIVVDALRPDHLGMYGYDKPTTPFLDELAAQSFVFVNAYVNAPWTRSSTASMLTGLYPSQHRTQSDRSKLPADIRTVAQDLKRAGYRTAAVVGNGNAGSMGGLNRGFDYYIDTVTHWDGLPAAPDVYAEALTFLKQQQGSKTPWFLFLFLVDPHDPYHAPPEYEAQWLKGIAGEPRRRAHWEYNNKYPENERRSMIALYDASIRYTDDQTRLLFDQIKALGLYQNTTVVFSADHGEAFGEHGYYLHAYHHTDEFVRVPLIIRSPAWQGSGLVYHLVQEVDLAPTLMGLAGRSPRLSHTGKDLTALLQKPINLDRMAISEYNEFGIHRSAAFNLRYRVILQLPAEREVFLSRIPRPELLPSVSFEKEVVQVYDRPRDPHERANLAPDRIPPQAATMLQGLRAYMMAAPQPNQDLDPKKMPQAVIDDLKALGYVQ
ncbi:MAG: sulfatase [Deltaproteobacteria bacterium]|nr:sulfatase [Deltaproteobacteria bacterium]